MNCFPCFRKSETADNDVNDVPVAPPKDNRVSIPQSQPQPQPQPQSQPQPTTGQAPPVTSTDDGNGVDSSNIQAKQFTFRELATATKHFKQECLLSERGFGRIYKGTLQPNGEVVFVKRLDKNSTQGNKEFLVEVMMLSVLHHTNLLNLVGYCADGDQRLLVYEYMHVGSVEDHLLDLKPDKKPLDWENRMKIACGTAQGLEYLHEKANPPIIYRDLKCSNIMLDDEFNPKLSDYGLAKLGGNNKQVMGSYGYCAPEYEKHGELTFKSDVYSFGVILLELITGRKAVDTSRQSDEQNLVTWAQPIFRDPTRFPELADARLGNSFPVKSLNQAVGVAAMCLQDEPDVRPLITDVVAALSFLGVASAGPESPRPELKAPSRKESRRDYDNKEKNVKAPSRKESRRDKNKTEDSDGESSESSWSSDDEQNDDEKASSEYEPVSEAIMRLNSKEKDEDRQQKKAKSVRYPSSSWGRMDSIEYEVASMSSSSSNSDNESERGSINKSSKKFQIATNKPSKSSTKKYRKESDEGSCNEGLISRSSRKSSRNTSAHLGSKGRNDVLENQNVDSDDDVENDKN